TFPTRRASDLIQIHRVRYRRAFIEAVQVDVIEQQTAAMRINQRERGTRYVLFINVDSVRDPFPQHRLASSQRPIEQNDLSARKLGPKADSEIEGFARTPGSDFPGNACCRNGCGHGFGGAIKE